MVHQLFCEKCRYLSSNDKVDIYESHEKKLDGYSRYIVVHSDEPGDYTMHCVSYTTELKGLQTEQEIVDKLLSMYSGEQNDI